MLWTALSMARPPGGNRGAGQRGGWSEEAQARASQPQGKSNWFELTPLSSHTRNCWPKKLLALKDKPSSSSRVDGQPMAKKKRAVRLNLPGHPLSLSPPRPTHNEAALNSQLEKAKKDFNAIFSARRTEIGQGHQPEERSGPYSTEAGNRKTAASGE